MLFEQSVTRETISIVCLGLCFMILFSAEFTMINMQKTIVSSIQDDRPEFQVDGYTLHGITYSVTCIGYWLAPSVITVIGPKLGMVVAAVGYSIYISSMNAEEPWVMYSVAVVVGLSNTLLWTGEGNYLTVVSKSEHIPRNIGIFWMLFISAEFYGNLFAYVKLSGMKYIDRDTRRLIIYVLACIAIISAVFFSLLKKIKVEKSGETKQGPLEAFKKTWKLFKTKNLLILSATFCFTGLQQAFVSGIYGPSIGFTLDFGNNAKQLVALAGISLGAGDFLGGVCQFIFNKRIRSYKHGRSAIITIGCVTQVTAYILIFLNLPNSAVFGNTNEHAIMKSSATIAMLCSALLGLGDSCLNTQNYSILAALYPESSSQAVALYKFNTGMCIAASFYLSSHLGLHKQVLLLCVAAVISTVAYCTVDRRTCNHISTDEKSVSSNTEVTEIQEQSRL